MRARNLVLALALCAGFTLACGVDLSREPALQPLPLVVQQVRQVPRAAAAVRVSPGWRQAVAVRLYSSRNPAGDSSTTSTSPVPHAPDLTDEPKVSKAASK